MIGHELDKRYEIIERVGGGGMALVYKAHDKMLGRKVAVKILRQQLTNDDEFIRRFRREAQAAATLSSHPNVVSIYDVGQEGDVHYIIMEYVEGINLNDRIKQHAPLQVEEAVHIASQICDALDHAHQHQIIHRDIKPHNILIGKNGRIKVTDFGIARAAASSDITQTGAVLGSVHYFSPEHAKGVSQGAKSDLYSLGIVLYQMLTARLPFLGDSPISVALKHLQEKVEEPRKVNPLIPQSVENIILKALRKNPDERYSSAKQMLQDLETCLLPQRLNEPMLQLGPELDEDDDERTIVVPAIRGNAFDEQPAGAQDDKRWHDLEERTTRRWIWVKPVIWITIVFLLLGGMWYTIGKVKEMIEVHEVEVPSVIGLTLEEAKAELEKAGLTLGEVEERNSDEFDEGLIMDQEKKGEIAVEQSPISLVVSLGPALLEMKDYVGRSWEMEVRSELEALQQQLDVTVEVEEVFNEAESGTVVKQYPDAGQLYDPKITVIQIEVSKGTGTVPMIDVITRKEQVAIAMLEKEGFNVKVIREKAYAPVDQVFKQWPYEPGDLVEPGAEITIHVSDGLPDEAAEIPYAITVPPLEDAETTQVIIRVSDAYGDHVEKRNVEITEVTPFTVQLVISPTKPAVISVTRNGLLYHNETKTYQDALNSMNPEFEVEELDPIIPIIDDGVSSTDEPWFELDF